MVDRVLADIAKKGDHPDFVLCIGDDRSDEDMFLAMEHVTFSPHMPAEVCPPFSSPRARYLLAAYVHRGVPLLLPPLSTYLAAAHARRDARPAPISQSRAPPW